MKRIQNRGGWEPERKERRSSMPPLTEPPAGGYKDLPHGKVFDYAYELCKRQGLSSGEALSDLNPELCSEIRKRNLMDLLTLSLNVISMDYPEVEKQITDVFRRQLISSTPEEIRKLVSLIPALYTMPDFQHVREKARLSGIILTDDEVRKMCWVLRGYINYMNQKFPDSDP